MPVRARSMQARARHIPARTHLDEPLPEPLRAVHATRIGRHDDCRRNTHASAKQYTPHPPPKPPRAPGLTRSFFAKY